MTLATLECLPMSTGQISLEKTKQNKPGEQQKFEHRTTTPLALKYRLTVPRIYYIRCAKINNGVCTKR